MKLDAAFIFDLDGTLIDNMDYHNKAWRIFLDENEISLSDEEISIKTQGTIQEAIPKIFDTKLSSAEISKLCNRKEDIYREIYRSHLKPIEGAEDFLRRTKEVGIRIALGTSAGKANIDFALDGLGFDSLFEVIVGGDDVSRGKPHPETFLRISEALGVSPQNCLVFEDSPAGINAARTAEMQVIFINSRKQPLLSTLTGKFVAERRDYLGLAPGHILKYLNHPG